MIIVEILSNAFVAMVVVVMSLVYSLSLHSFVRRHGQVLNIKASLLEQCQLYSALARRNVKEGSIISYRGLH